MVESTLSEQQFEKMPLSDFTCLNEEFVSPQSPQLWRVYDKQELAGGCELTGKQMGKIGANGFPDGKKFENMH